MMITNRIIAVLFLSFQLVGCDQFYEYTERFSRKFHLSRQGKIEQEATKAPPEESIQFGDDAPDASEAASTVKSELPDSPASVLADSQIKITSSQAVEGSNFFSLRFQCSVRSDDDDYSSYGKCQVNAADAQARIKIDPPVDFKLVSGPDEMILIGSFLPNSRYSVLFQKGIVTNEAKTLTADFRDSVQTPAFRKSFRFSSKARYLPKIDSAELEFEARNIADVQLLVEKIHPQNIIYWLTKNTESSGADLGEELFQKKLKISSVRNKKMNNRIKLAELDQAEPGVYSVSAWSGEPNKSEQLDRSSFVYTDIASIVKQDDDSIKIWTRSLRDMNALGGIEVSLLNMANRELGSCTTAGTDSSCSIKLQPDQSFKPYALILKAKNDVSFLRFSDLEIDSSKFKGDRRPFLSTAPLEAYIYSSQGVYRPGDVVNLSAVVRTSSQDVADETSLKWRLYNPQSKVQKIQTATTDGNGMMHFSFATSDFASTGQYTVELLSGDTQIGQYRFMIEEIVPERVSIQLTENSGTTESQSVLDVQANYLFGPPVASAKFKAICKIEPISYEITGNPGWFTGLAPSATSKPLSLLISELDQELDVNGKASTSCSYGDTIRRINAPAQLNTSVAVSEAGSGRKSRRSFSKTVAAAKEFVGIRMLSRPGDKSVSVEARLFDLDRHHAKGNGKAVLTLYRLESNWIYAYDPELGYSHWLSEDILIPTGKAETIDWKDGLISHTWNPDASWGRFLAQVEDTERRSLAQSSFQIGYDYWSGTPDTGNLPAPRSPDEFLMVGPNQPIKPGSSFKIEFEAPFAGWALFTVETNRLHSTSWIRVARGKGTAELTAPDKVANFYVSALLSKDPIEGNQYIPARAWGSTSIKLDRSKTAVKVSIVAPEKTRSNRKIPIEIRLDPPASSSVTLAAVDEGILQLTNFSSPDPASYFDAERQLGVRSFESLGWTFMRHLKADKTGGDEAGSGASNGRAIPIKMISIWQSELKTDRKGYLKTEIEMPVFQGKIRLMVVAANRDRYGSGQSSVIVADPLALQPTVPRFLSSDDVFEVPVQVINTTDKKLNVEITAGTNDAVKLELSSHKAVLKPQASTLVKFPARALSFAGTAQIRIEARSGKFSTFESFDIPIIPATPEVSFSKQMRLSQDFNISNLVPSELRMDRLIAHVSISNMPYLGGLSRIAELVHYPYGCIEQTTSSSFPLLVMNDLSPWLKSLDAKLADINQFAQAGISRVLSMQTGSGGFGYWPGNTNPEFWGTAYATHMLLTAKDFGFEVPKENIDSALDYLVETLKQRDVDSDWVESDWHARSYRDAEPYAHFVLALGGRGQAGRLRDLTSKPDKFYRGMADENRFLIAAALHKSGEAALATQVLSDWKKTEPASYGERYASGSFWSRHRSDGMRLAIAEDLWPDEPRNENLAMQVSSILSSNGYLTTQEMAWGLIGLAKRAKSFKANSVDSVQLLANGQQVAAEADFAMSKSWDLSKYDIAKTRFQISDPDAKAGDPIFVMNGRGFSKDFQLAKTAPSDFSIEREYLDLRGDSVNLSEMKQGDMVVIRMKIKSKRNSDSPNIAITDRLPAGFEIENQRLGQGLNLDWMEEDRKRFAPDYFEIRDDRIELFGKVATGEQEYFYTVRAITAGEFTIPPAKIESMYEPDEFAYSSYLKLIVRP
jgi:uncharacterized protein YfaS (alpha-2-macroglobulin family)